MLRWDDAVEIVRPLDHARKESNMNLWERAKEAIEMSRSNFADVGYSSTANWLGALLAEMERVECVEGVSRDDPKFAPMHFWPDKKPVGNDRHALLLLLPEDKP